MRSIKMISYFISSVDYFPVCLNYFLDQQLEYINKVPQSDV